MKTPSYNLSQRLVLYGLSIGAVAGVAIAGKGKPNKPKNHIRWSGPEEFDGNFIFFDLHDLTPPSNTPMAGDDFGLFANCDYGYRKNSHKAFATGKDLSDEKSKIAVAPGKCNNIDAIQFQAGEQIGPQTFFYYGSMAYRGYGYFNDCLYSGQWAPGDRGFLGLKIRIGCDYFFGWADVTLNTLSCEDGPQLTLHSYAINLEANESIAAGEKKTKAKHIHVAPPSCTPTPTITPSGAGSAIALLIAGAAGIPALRQRRE